MQTCEAEGAIEEHEIRFTGDGGVYFGIWIVNLLLMIVTLGLYTPFARRRTVKYFYGHTLVAGSPLEFTAPLRRMFFGFLLFFGLYVAYQIAASTGQQVAVAVFVFGGIALAPLLWASAMRFRLSATRWRGIRGRFDATLGEVYHASWPAIVAAGAASFLTLVLGEEFISAHVKWLATVAALLVGVMCVVRLEFNYASLLFSRADFGSQPGRWKPVYRDFVRIWLAAFGFFFAVVIVLSLIVGLVVGGSIWTFSTTVRTGAFPMLVAAFAFIGAFFMIFLASGPARAYREARMFRLVWSNVGLGKVARFRCNLGMRAYVMLRIKNMLLSIITMGFYRPFAITSEYRMKVESVTLHVKGGLDQLAGRMAQQQGSVGDAIADAVGLDLVG